MKKKTSKTMAKTQNNKDNQMPKRKLVSAVFKTLLATTLLVGLDLAAPRLHTQYIRNNIGDSVVMLTNKKPGSAGGYGGGTGFHIKAKSGKTVVLSNRHVCMAGKEQGFMFGSVRGRTKIHKLKIVELFSDADLCVLEPIRGAPVLKLGSPPKEGQSVWVIGHPNLQPRTVTKGEVQGFEWMAFAVGAIGYSGFTEEDCKYNNRFIAKINKNEVGTNTVFNKIIDFNITSMIESESTVRFCVEKNLSMVTNVPIYKGNSGSPVVDDFGNVVSVIFATNMDGMWGQAITFFDLSNLLLKY
jgi:S1-C subfamily serine protease